MRHRKAGRKLGRNSSHRKAMYRNMVTSLMLHGRITTTEAKAKELRGYAERNFQGWIPELVGSVAEPNPRFRVAAHGAPGRIE